MAPQRRRCIVTAKQSAVKRYVVRLSDEERERLDALTNMGKHPARLLTKARILLKADASEAGEGWSDSRIAEALDTSTDTVARTRQQTSEAKLIALACSPPPKGRKRWTLQLLEKAVVELNIVERASDNTIGRTLKKTLSSRTCRNNGSFRRMPMRRS